MNYLRYSLFCNEKYNQIIKENTKYNKIVIFGLSWCPWTHRAKRIIIENENFFNIYTNNKEDNIENKGKISPVMIIPDVINNDFKLEMLYCLYKNTGTTYTPQIWINNKHIGDFEDLYRLVELNKNNY